MGISKVYNDMRHLHTCAHAIYIYVCVCEGYAETSKISNPCYLNPVKTLPSQESNSLSWQQNLHLNMSLCCTKL